MKKPKRNILFCIDRKRRVCSSYSDSSVLFSIDKAGKDFSVRYYGCCEVFLGRTYRDAYNYILSKVNYIVKEDGSTDFWPGGEFVEG